MEQDLTKQRGHAAHSAESGGTVEISDFNFFEGRNDTALRDLREGFVRKLYDNPPSRVVAIHELDQWCLSLLFSCGDSLPDLIVKEVPCSALKKTFRANEIVRGTGVHSSPTVQLHSLDYATMDMSDRA